MAGKSGFCTFSKYFQNIDFDCKKFQNPIIVVLTFINLHGNIVNPLFSYVNLCCILSFPILHTPYVMSCKVTFHRRHLAT
jgi:hypothetical protein